MQQNFQRSVDSLAPIVAFTEAFFSAENVPPALLGTVNFAIEELFTNMVKYNADGPDEILLSLKSIDRGVQVSLVDFDTEPFDPTRAKPAKVDGPIEERPVGGLGLHLIKQMVDSLSYEYANRRSTVTFTRTVDEHV